MYRPLQISRNSSTYPNDPVSELHTLCIFSAPSPRATDVRRYKRPKNEAEHKHIQMQEGKEGVDKKQNRLRLDDKPQNDRSNKSRGQTKTRWNNGKRGTTYKSNKKWWGGKVGGEVQ